MLGDVAFAQAPFASQGGNTFNVAVSETGSSASTPDIGSVIFGGFITEGISALDSLSALATFVGINNESASGAAVFDTLNNTFNVLFSSAASGGASTSSQSAFVAAVNEFVVLATAEFYGQAGAVASVAESASASAAHQGGLVILMAVTEAASGADTRVGNYVSPVSIQESAVGDDTVNVLKTFNVDATGVQLVVRIGSILIWAEIDDSQDPNWQNIPT